MAMQSAANGPMDNLYSNLGPLTRTVKSDTQNQLNGVAINSGIIGVTSNDTNTWTAKNDTRYGVNVNQGKDKTQSYPVNDSYLNN